jgi:hypothetical protein
MLLDTVSLNSTEINFEDIKLLFEYSICIIWNKIKLFLIKKIMKTYLRQYLAADICRYVIRTSLEA